MVASTSGQKAPPATPRDARAWRMRASARRKSRLARMAISTRAFEREGSLKACHQSMSAAGSVVVLLGVSWVTTSWPFQASGTLVLGLR